MKKVNYGNLFKLIRNLSIICMVAYFYYWLGGIIQIKTKCENPIASSVINGLILFLCSVIGGMFIITMFWVTYDYITEPDKDSSASNNKKHVWKLKQK